jgi:transposase InsO family protein
VDYMVRSHGISQRRACRLLRQNRNICFYESVADPHLEVRARMREITQTRVRFGYRRVHIMLRREGCAAGKKLVYRLYREENLQLRQAPEAAQDGRGTAGSVRADAARPSLGNGLCFRSAGQWQDVPCIDDRGRLQSRSACS